jgi:hypothetical protein
MPGPPTPNLGLAVPTVGGDFNTWGNELNGDLAILDNLGAFAVNQVSASGGLILGVNPISVFLASGGAVGIVLIIPSPASFPGRIVTVKKVDAANGTVQLVPLSGNIDGSPSLTLFNQYQFVMLYSDGTNLNVIGAN